MTPFGAKAQNLEHYPSVDEEHGVSRGDVFHRKARQGKGQQGRKYTIGYTSSKKGSSTVNRGLRTISP